MLKDNQGPLKIVSRKDWAFMRNVVIGCGIFDVLAVVLILRHI
jgi:hypothetical protein